MCRSHYHDVSKHAENHRAQNKCAQHPEAELPASNFYPASTRRTTAITAAANRRRAATPHPVKLSAGAYVLVSVFWSCRTLRRFFS